MSRRLNTEKVDNCSKNDETERYRRDLFTAKQKLTVLTARLARQDGDWSIQMDEAQKKIKKLESESEKVTDANKTLQKHFSEIYEKFLLKLEKCQDGIKERDMQIKQLTLRAAKLQSFQDQFTVKHNQFSLMSEPGTPTTVQHKQESDRMQDTFGGKSLFKGHQGAYSPRNYSKVQFEGDE